MGFYEYDHIDVEKYFSGTEQCVRIKFRVEFLQLNKIHSPDMNPALLSFNMEASNRTGGIIRFLCNQIEDKKFGHNDAQKY